MPEGSGPHHADKETQRLRVRLHYGGTFAQDGPHQWRYVGGEVFNESFPLECQYHLVSKRLNDKFGDPVSFKYLCPGDELDPDNLVQVQGDDDLEEMRDEYVTALQTSSSVKTVRIKVFVFRAVIFEREVQEQDEELIANDEDADAESAGDLRSSDPEESGPNWDEWGDPDEQLATGSSLPTAHPSSDAELHNGTYAANAAAAATAALRNINMGTNGHVAGATAVHVPRAPLSAVAAAWGVARSGNGGSSSGGYGISSRQARVPEAEPIIGVAAHGWAAPSAGGEHGEHEDVEAEAYGCDDVGEHTEQQYEDAEYGDEDAVELPYEQQLYGGQAYGIAAAYDGYAYEDDPYADSSYAYGLYAKPQCDREAPAAAAAVHGGQPPQRQQRQLYVGRGGWEHRGAAERRWRGPADEERQREHQLAHALERDLELEQSEQWSERQEGQCAQQLEDRRCARGGPQQRQEQRSLSESGAGFYCDEELEDPYGEPYHGDAHGGADQHRAAAGADAEDAFGEGKARSDDAERRVAAGLPPAEATALPASGRAFGGEGTGRAGAHAGRALAAVDMLPRHISIFGESSRDNSLGGGAGGGSFPGLPSRITIFGDDESMGRGTLGGGGSTGRPGDGGAPPPPQPHRLAFGASGAGAARWPALGGGGGAVLHGGDGSVHLQLDLVAGESRQCITQEFGMQQHSSLLDMDDQQADEGGHGGRASPFDPLDPLMRIGLGGGLDGLDGLGGSEAHNHPLRGVVKKRKSEVTILAKIGEGAFGEVSQAQVFPYGIVAVKWLKRERFAKYSESFQREAEMLARLNHPNIIRMYGLVMDSAESPSYGGAPPHSGESGDSGGAGPGGAGLGGPGGTGTSGAGTPTGLIGGIITEFVRNGSLGQYLRALNGRRLSLRQRAMIALQAALGMAYLHEQSPAVVHFDLKPDNLLVDGEADTMVIKVADFGLSKHKLSNYVSCRDLRGTLPYMAYELVSGNGNISEKVDVYSMGVVMWEMYTGEVPFAHLAAQEILSGLVHGNLHLAIPPACEPEWRSLVETCMDFNPANRPSFQELAMQLQEILRLERQASNASSCLSGSAAMAAAAALRDSSGHAGGAAAGGLGDSATNSGAGGANVPPPQPQLGHLLQPQLPFMPSVPAPPPLVLPLPANLLAQQQPQLVGLQLRPQALFGQVQQPHAQHMNGLYGLIGGGAGAGLPPLVSWGDRGM
ncbi:hypothetical protein GPECTOR_36g121 [Gonium pectorale]|uniref:Protein kinase domain-containing protein n=1 Tax=Gonium pectorale TaxID=33097 RepID=A0A150GBR0_GONPE|nr:hypothetical protein GPECTOR_36g121 [Gonium pectorale]|eukprot:KXZ47269.1 hypothetical protein GPECTOR_36g121 [Gonium pectorale]